MTQEDIDFGVPKSPTNCPIARCIKRILIIEDVLVGLRVRIYNSIYHLSSDGDKDIYLFQSQFDSGYPVEPIEFSLIGGSPLLTIESFSSHRSKLSQ